MMKDESKKKYVQLLEILNNRLSKLILNINKILKSRSHLMNGKNKILKEGIRVKKTFKIGKLIKCNKISKNWSSLL